MASDIQFTPQEAMFFLVLTGMRPPLIPTATLYEAGNAANDTANRIDNELTPLVDELVSQVLTGMNSAVSPEFADALAQYTSKPPGYFPETSAALRQMGDYAVSTAGQVEYMKIMAITTLASLIASLVIEAAIAFFFPEVGLEMMAAEFAIVRFLLNTLIGRVLAHILSATLIGIVIQVLLDSIAQAVLIGEGIQKNWNWKETGLQVAVGALGGAMGLVLHPVSEFVSHELADVFKNLLGKDGENFADKLAIDGAEDLTKVPGGGPAKDLPGDLPKDAPGGGPAGDEPDMRPVPGGQEPRPDGSLGDGPKIDEPMADGPKVDEPKIDEPGWTAPTPVGSRDWVIDHLAQIPTSIVIGGVHNAGHETLFSLMTTGKATWNWATFAGGAAQALTHPIGVLLGGGTRMAFGLPVPAENLLAGALGKVTPSMLNDIASAPAVVPAGTGGKSALSEPGASGPVNEKGAPFEGKGLPSGGSGPSSEQFSSEPVPATSLSTEPVPAVSLSLEPPAVQVLRAAGLPPGPDTAYSIALRTGFVPTIGPAQFHSLYARPVMADLPRFTTSADLVGVVRPELPAAIDRPGSPDQPAQPYSLVDAPRSASPTQLPGSPGDLPAPTPARESVKPGEGGLPDSAMDEPVPASAERMPVLTPDQSAPAPPTSLPDQSPPASADRLATPGPDSPAPSADSKQETPPVSAPPRATPRPDQPGGQPTVQPSGSGHHAPATQAAHGAQTHAADVTARPRPSQGRQTSAPDRQTPAPDWQTPAVRSEDGSPRTTLHAAGTDWTPNATGLHEAHGLGSLDRGADGLPSPVEVSAGSTGVFDGSGQLAYLRLPDGVSYERDLAGVWSAGRAGSGEVVVVKTSDPVTLTSSDGTAAVELPPESEKVLDQGTPVAYRQVRASDGTRLAEPRVFLPDSRGGWAQTSSPVDGTTYEAWLASANQAPGAARTLHDIAARSGPQVLEAERLTNLDDAALKDLLGGSRDDTVAGVYEWVRRSRGVALRWTQLAGSHALAGGDVVNMAAGEGKSWLFLVDAARQAAGPGGRPVQVITTRGNLADREFESYTAVLGPLGFDVHRMNSGRAAARPPVAGRPAVYVGTSQDVGFTWLRQAWCRVRRRAGRRWRGSARGWMRWMRRSCTPTVLTSCRRERRARRRTRSRRRSAAPRR